MTGFVWVAVGAALIVVVVTLLVTVLRRRGPADEARNRPADTSGDVGFYASTGFLGVPDTANTADAADCENAGSWDSGGDAGSGDSGGGDGGGGCD